MRRPVFINIYILLAFTLLGSCTATKIADKTGIEEIKFGGGGGFTGKVDTYTLTAEGKLLEQDKELKKLPPKTTLSLFKQAQAFENYSFNEPGNVYCFIEIKMQGKANNIVWSFGSVSVNDKVPELYKKLIATTK